MDREALWGTVHGVARSWTQLSTHNKSEPFKKIINQYEYYLEVVYLKKKKYHHLFFCSCTQITSKFSEVVGGGGVLAGSER